MEDKEKAERPKNEVVIWGFGSLLNKIDELNKRVDRNSFLLAKIETKLDKLIEITLAKK